MQIETIKLWSDREDVELTTFLTMPDKFIPNPPKKPAIIVCPGGAYMSCPRHGTEGDTIAMSFAVDGYQSFVLEYSVVERAPKGKTLFPAQIIDLGKAILTIRENAEEWCIDPEKISIIGFSAGAHLCGMYSSTWNEPLLKETFGVKSEMFKPLTAMLIYGLLDYTVQEEFRKSGGFPSILPNDLNVPVFGVEDPDEELQKKYSPVYLVNKNTPPTFLAAAMDDGMVPSIQTVYMAERLHKNKIPYEIHMFEFGDHGFSLGRNLFEPFREDKSRACSQWLPLAKTFLMHHIALETTEIEKSIFSFFEM